MDVELPKPVVRSEAGLGPVVERSSTWLPEPSPDPNLLRRLRNFRWERGAILVLLGGGWLAYAWLMFMPHAHVVAFISPMITVTIMLWNRVRTSRASPYVGDLLDLPAVVPQYPVEVVYRVYETAYGRDEGIVSILDGWLHFQGRRTTFSVRYAVIDHRLLPQRSQQFKDRRAHRLLWNFGKDSFAIDIEPLDQLDGLGKGLASKLQSAMVEWRSHRSSQEGMNVWPPRMPMPGLVRRMERLYLVWTFMLGTSVAVSLGSIAGYFLSDSDQILQHILTFLGSMVCCAVVAFARQRKAKQLQDIERGCERSADEANLRGPKGRGSFPRGTALCD